MIKNIIGYNIKAFRKSRGMTLDQLAEKVGLTKSTLSRYELGQYEPKFQTVCEIAGALGVNPASIYGFGPTSGGC